MSWMHNMPLLRSLIFNDDNQAINILASYGATNNLCFSLCAPSAVNDFLALSFPLVKKRALDRGLGSFGRAFLCLFA